jgi:hypothetical protein
VKLHLLFAAAALLPMAAIAQAQPVTLTSESVIEVDKLAKTVTDALIAGDAKRAVNAFAAGSPLMAGKSIELGSLEAQVGTAFTAYGPITSIELAKQQVYGTSAVRRYYVARHEKMVTRWELVFSRTSKGWIIGYFGFDDQQRSWFE